MDEMRQTRGHLEPRDVCAMSEYDDPRLNKTNQKTTCTFMSSVEFHVLCVDLGFHVVIGVGASHRSVSPRVRNSKFSS